MTAQSLARIANELRVEVLRMVKRAKAGHVAGPLSAADIVANLYFGGKLDLNIDKIILSCGHYAPVLYAALEKVGYINKAELESFMQLGSRLPGHPERGLTPGIEVSAGPLGQGVSVAVGMALGLKMKFGHKSQRETPKIYCILSDGELQEGQVWEAFNFAVRRQLDNLIFILDRNRIQIENFVSQLATYGEVGGRLEAFGLHTIEIDGNEAIKISDAIEKAKQVMGGPAIIVANTVGGKGVSFMENSPGWHDRVPTESEFQQAIKELNV